MHLYRPDNLLAAATFTMKIGLASLMMLLGIFIAVCVSLILAEKVRMVVPPDQVMIISVLLLSAMSIGSYVWITRRICRRTVAKYNLETAAFATRLPIGYVVMITWALLYMDSALQSDTDKGAFDG